LKKISVSYFHKQPFIEIPQKAVKQIHALIAFTNLQKSQNQPLLRLDSTELSKKQVDKPMENH